MENIINYENLRLFAYSNDKLIKGKPTGIVLKFTGLGDGTIHKTDPADALDFAKHGIIYVIPYYNPWCWMNEETVIFVDRIVEVLCDRYDLDREGVRIASTGSSMGGLSSLVYCAYAKITPCLCASSCPVCDLVYHFTEREDLPRTLYSAFASFNGTLTCALESRSPIHLAEKLPDIPYTIFHCEEDKMVDLQKHSRAFADKMKGLRRVTLVTVPEKDHCDLPQHIRDEYKKLVIDGILQG